MIRLFDTILNHFNLSLSNQSNVSISWINSGSIQQIGTFPNSLSDMDLYLTAAVDLFIGTYTGDIFLNPGYFSWRHLFNYFISQATIYLETSIFFGEIFGETFLIILFLQPTGHSTSQPVDIKEIVTHLMDLSFSNHSQWI